MQTVDPIWTDIEEWLREHAPEQVENLQAPATDAQIAEFEAATGLTVPEDYVASLRRHDGYIYLDDYEYVPLENVLDTWTSMKENLEEGEYDELEVVDTGGGVIRDTFWNPGWIPFAEDSGGNLLCIDTAPGPNGTPGQIVRWEVHVGPGHTEHASFAAWLGAFRDDLAEGRFEVIDGSVERKEP